MGERAIARATKVCTQCGKRKPIESGFHFSREVGGTVRYRSSCKKCRSAYSLKWQLRNPERRKLHWEVQRSRRKENGMARHSYYMWRYGISLEEYQNLSKRQNDLCAICRHPELTNGVNGVVRVLSVDHDHKTGKVRGLLCFLCNAMLGNIEKIGLEKISQYLEVNK